MTKMKKRNRKRVSLILSMLLVTSILCNFATADAYIVHVGYYRDTNFTTKSDGEYVHLNMETTTISVDATCANGATDTLTCYIVDYTDSHEDDYSFSFSFPANGTLTTVAQGFPPGRYKVHFRGSSNIVKTDAEIYFTVIE